MARIRVALLLVSAVVLFYAAAASQQATSKSEQQEEPQYDVYVADVGPARYKGGKRVRRDHSYKHGSDYSSSSPPKDSSDYDKGSSKKDKEGSDKHGDSSSYEHNYGPEWYEKPYGMDEYHREYQPYNKPHDEVGCMILGGAGFELSEAWYHRCRCCNFACFFLQFVCILHKSFAESTIR